MKKKDKAALKHIYIHQADDLPHSVPGTHGSNLGPYFLLPKANMQDQPLPGHSQG